jgi:hypothetical protein
MKPDFYAGVRALGRPSKPIRSIVLRPSSSSSLVLDALKGGGGDESTQDASATTATHTITPTSAVVRWWSVG